MNKAEGFYPRRLSIVPIIQSLGQLEKNYGKEGAEIIIDNTQLTIFGGFAPNSETAQVMSKSLGSSTVLSGSVSRSKNDPSQSLQMPDNGSRPVKYASKKALVQTIQELFHPELKQQNRKKSGKVVKFAPMKMTDPEELKARIRGQATPEPYSEEGDADEQT